MSGRWPWSRHQGAHASSVMAAPGDAYATADGAAGSRTGDPQSRPRHLWPVAEPSDHRIELADHILATYPDRFPDLDQLEIDQLDPATRALIVLCTELHEAAVTYRQKLDFFHHPPAPDPEVFLP